MNTEVIKLLRQLNEMNNKIIEMQSDQIKILEQRIEKLNKNIKQ
mgnify:FL=1